MANDDTTMPPQGMYVLSEAEMKLIRRIRSLQSGEHLAIIHIDGKGVNGLTLVGFGSPEKLRRIAEQV